MQLLTGQGDVFWQKKVTTPGPFTVNEVLTVDQSYYTLCPGAEVIARVAENVEGVRYKRVAFPDAPPPASPEMFTWMRPDTANVVEAARAML